MGGHTGGRRDKQLSRPGCRCRCCCHQGDSAEPAPTKEAPTRAANHLIERYGRDNNRHSHYSANLETFRPHWTATFCSGPAGHPELSAGAATYLPVASLYLGAPIAVIDTFRLWLLCRRRGRGRRAVICRLWWAPRRAHVFGGSGGAGGCIGGFHVGRPTSAGPVRESTLCGPTNVASICMLAALSLAGVVGVSAASRLA